MNSKFNNWNNNFQKEIIKGKPIKVNQRTIYPVIQINYITIKDIFWFESVIPIAIAVIEPDEKYLMFLTETDCDNPELDGLCAEMEIKNKIKCKS